MFSQKTGFILEEAFLAVEQMNLVAVRGVRELILLVGLPRLLIWNNLDSPSWSAQTSDLEQS